MNKGFFKNLLCDVICCLILAAPSQAEDPGRENGNARQENEGTVPFRSTEFQSNDNHASVITDEKTAAERPENALEHRADREQIFAEQCTGRLTVQGSPYKEGECLLSDGHLSVKLTPYNKYRSNIENIITGEARTEAMKSLCGLFHQTELINSVEYRFLDEQGNVFKLIQLQKNDCRTPENE